MKNLLLRDDDSPRRRKKTFRSNFFWYFSRSLTWMDMDLHLDVSNQTHEQLSFWESCA
ncbi:unnamed protein product [Brassica rapa subsp. trilocularis]